METRVYNYLGEHNIGIRGSKEILDRIEGNVDEEPHEDIGYEGIVRIKEEAMKSLVRDKNFPYLSIMKNKERNIEGYDYLRYNTPVRTIWKESPIEYGIINHLQNDETGALKCFKKIYYSLPKSIDKALVHAAALNISGEGILIVGKRRSGKTTLAFNLIDRIGASLVEGGNTLISFNEGLNSYYLPRPIFARFSTIVDSPYLSLYLEDIEKTQSIQPWDIEGINEVIKSKSFSVDGGLTFSRRSFRELSGKKTLPSSNINTLIFPHYSKGKKVSIKSLLIDEAYKKILEREFEINSELISSEDQDNIKNPLNSKIKLDWISGLKFKSIGFDGNKEITNSLLEDLLS